MRGTTSRDKVRFNPLTANEIEQRKKDKKLRVQEAIHWKTATNTFIEHVLKYRDTGGLDETLNNKIKAYLHSLNIDYNAYIIRQDGKQMGRKWWISNAYNTQRAQQKTFFDLVKETESERQRERRKHKQNQVVCFLHSSKFINAHKINIG